MAKLLSIDYGSKRTGLAETDELQIIASPLTTVETKTFYTFLANYLQKNDVETIVIGDPRRTNGEDTHATEGAHLMAEKIAKLYPKIQIARVDEMYTSKLAFQAMIDGGMKKKDRRNKGNIDKISATIMLQQYMEKGS